MTTYERVARYNSQSILVPSEVHVLLLAGGQGARLKAADDLELRERPKLLLHVRHSGESRSMVSTCLAGLGRAGFRYVTLLTSAVEGSGGRDIEREVLKYVPLGIGLHISREPLSLGTAGAAYAALRHNGHEVVLIVPGDTLFPFEMFAEGLVSHQVSDLAITWFVTSESGPKAQNVNRLVVDETGQLLASFEHEITEIPTVRGAAQHVTSAGAVIADADRFRDLFEIYADKVRPSGQVDLYRDFIPWLLKSEVQVGTFDLKAPAPDLGTLERFHEFGRATLRSRPFTSEIEGRS